MRTNRKDILLRHPAQYKTKNEILENVEQKYGGCKGCKYWTACYGGCPSGAINNDWRNRTYLCSVWKALFEFYEKILGHLDISICQESRSTQAGICHADSNRGSHGDSHGDHTDFKRKDTNIPHRDSGHGDSGHGDVPHGDSPHGDV